MSVFIENLKYLTIAEYKSSSSSDLINQTDEIIQINLSLSEKIISEMIIRIEESIENVPLNIKQAMVLITDCQYLKSLEIFEKQTIIEEKDENHTRKYKINEKQPCIEEKVLLLLKPYRKTKNTSYIKDFRI